MIKQGDALTVLKTLESESVQTCITSPPYFGLRDYGEPGQIGLEDTAEMFVEKLVEVFREVKRVLRDDGTLWLNLGDSYVNNGSGSRDTTRWPKQSRNDEGRNSHKKKASNLKIKDLMGIPWRVAFALQADGWYLRSDIIWNKPNPMPESVTDRPTKSHEYIFLLSKSPVYYYDYQAIKEPAIYGAELPRGNNSFGPPAEAKADGRLGKGRILYEGKRTQGDKEKNGQQSFVHIAEKRNKRSVWTINTKPFSDAHFATFPEALIEPMVLAGAPQGGVCLDPFMGAGTTAVVALRNGRKYLGIELNKKYIALANKRLSTVTVPLL